MGSKGLEEVGWSCGSSGLQDRTYRISLLILHNWRTKLEIDAVNSESNLGRKMQRVLVLDESLEKRTFGCRYWCYVVILTTDDNEDVTPVIVPEKDSIIAPPSTPPGNDLNIAAESGSWWIDYIGPLTSDEIDSDKRWSYKTPM
ncbi:hypothetical protein Tco_0204666 [Tanacetum coccineum]